MGGDGRSSGQLQMLPHCGWERSVKIIEVIAGLGSARYEVLLCHDSRLGCGLEGADKTLRDIGSLSTIGN
jgi:hypothetical protein